VIDTGDPVAIKKWWSNNVFVFQAAKNYVLKMKDMVDYFEDRMEHLIFGSWYTYIRDWQTTIDTDVLWNDHEAEEVCQISGWFC
jgi:hypothetical protein